MMPIKSKELDEMKKVEGNFEYLYFHDSPVKKIVICLDTITLLLGFVHVLETHPQNRNGKIICAKHCQLIFSQVKESVLKLYCDEEKAWTLIESPEDGVLLSEILETATADKGEYTLSGMATGSQWSEWVIRAGTVSLLWKEEGASWLTNG